MKASKTAYGFWDLPAITLSFLLVALIEGRAQSFAAF